MSGPKVLLIDIETSPNKVYAWGLFKQNISISQITEPGYTMCWAAKWLGQKTVHFERVHGLHGTEEFQESKQKMVERAHALLDQADGVITYNGARFDMPTLNREFVLAGLTPPSGQHQIDLFRVVKKQFRFASNKLDFIARALGLEGKVQHKGMELWTECMADDPKAWRTMRRYNKQDVRMMEPLYMKLLPWIDRHPNMGLFTDGEVCVNCGSSDLQKRGFHHTATQTYQRYWCKACGKWQRARKNCTTNEERLVAA